VDTTPPELMSFTLAPTSIDVSASPQAVTATLRLTDDLSGVSGGQVTFSGPSSGPSFQSQVLFFNRIAGDAMDGMYEGTVNFPQFSENGTWTVSVFARDSAGNSATFTSELLASRSFPSELEVFSDPSDSQGPTLTDVSFTPSAIDVSGGAQDVVVRLDVTDDLSGAVFASPDPSLNFFPFSAMQLMSPSGQQFRLLSNEQFALVGGDLLAGTWEATLTVPPLVEPGNWTISFIGLRDVAANNTFLFAFQLDDAGLQRQLAVTSDPSDTRPPELTSFDFSPIVINTSTGFELVTVESGATDDLAGVVARDDQAPPFSFRSFVFFRSPSGQQTRFTGFWQLTSGIPSAGIWRATVFFPQFSEDGTWKVEQVSILDAVTNTTNLDTAALAALGFPTDLVVLRPSLDSDGQADSGGGTVTDDTFGDRASVTFPPGALSEPTNVAIDVFEEALDIPTPSGFEGPGTLFVNIELTPEPAFPLPPPGMTIVLPLEDPLVPGSPLDLFRVDPTTGDLVPAMSVFGGPVVGTVDAPDGLSATFEGVASLSTVVGLIPEIIPVEIDIRPGSEPNPVNLMSRGVLPVAVLGAAAFDVRIIDVTTLKFGPGEAPPAHDLTKPGVYIGHLEDVNGDGFTDLVVHFGTQQAGLSATDTEACIAGETLDGKPISGCDSIGIVPRR
jgi:serine protease